MKTALDDTLIDLRDPAGWRQRRPLLIAHRGGVIAPAAPENSLAAIRLAAAHGYDMVELDVAKPRDDEPVLFHDRTGSLRMNCGVDVPLVALTARELTAVRYRASEERITTLARALELCRELRLGVMLDIKAQTESQLTRAFVLRTGALLAEHGLTSAAVTITAHPLVREVLAGQVLFPVSADDFRCVCHGRHMHLDGQFWFGLPEQLPDTAVQALQENGAPVIPAINTFRYPPHAHTVLAGGDIARLRAAGVDGFQIDSAYEGFFTQR